MNEENMPGGYQMIAGKTSLKDPRGAWMPVENIKPQDLLIHDAVWALGARARALREELRELKVATLEECQSLRELILQEYGAQVGGAKGNMTLSSFDGSMQVKVAVQDQLDLGPEGQQVL